MSCLVDKKLEEIKSWPDRTEWIKMQSIRFDVPSLQFGVDAKYDQTKNFGLVEKSPFTPRTKPTNFTLASVARANGSDMRPMQKSLNLFAKRAVSHAYTLAGDELMDSEYSIHKGHQASRVK